MRRHVRRTPGGRPGPAAWLYGTLAVCLAVLALFATPAGAVAGTFTARASGTPRDARPHRSYTNAPCNHGHKVPGVADCMAVVTTSSDHAIRPDADAPPSGALGPADIQSAYHLPAGGAGQTVAIIDAYGDSQAESDLASFRSHYGLPPCTSASGCFRKVDQDGGTNYPTDDAGWGLETSLDLDAVSSACPKCDILLVEGQSPSTDDLGTAMDTAVALGAKYVSNSYGLPDTDTSGSDHYYDHPGVAVTASSGDAGNQVNWPSSSPDVISVGGTRLTPDASSARGWGETAWAQGGAGCSAYEPKPTYQSANGLDTQCAGRATSDIAADADPASGLATYDTLGYDGWMQIGGTSLASPLVAAMYALAGPPEPGTYPVADLYDPAHAGALFDVTSGTDGDCGDLLCQAGPGWDGPTGVGTPNGIAALSQGAHGDIEGQVTDSATGAGLAGATVSTPDGYQATTDSTGHYDLGAAVGTYDLTVSAYGYASATRAAVPVTADTTTALDVALKPVPSTTVSGVVTDGSGHGWPLYAEITVDGSPGGPVFTDPATGRYTLALPQQGTYSLHVSPAFEPGYVTKTVQVATGTSTAMSQDAALTVDQAVCTAPGYGWQGTGADFTGWTGATAQDGWSVQGSGHTWEFDNPAYRTAPILSDGQFAVADSDYYGPAKMDTSLVSPVIDLSAQSAPHLGFNTVYYGDSRNESATVDLSLDGGATWSTVWRQSTADAVGPVDLRIPQAAGHKTVRVRFHYTAKNAWWWALDNVFVGTRTCVPMTGSLVEGAVASTDHRPLVGAEVSSVDMPSVSGVSLATPDDPELADGYYWLFSPLTGRRSFAAGDDGHTTATALLTLTAGQITYKDWSLASG